MVAHTQTQLVAHPEALSPTYLGIKRGFDVCASLAALVLLVVPTALIWLAIRLDDPHGGGFYSQTRIGRDGRPFRMWKFRTMVQDAEQMRSALQSDVDGAMFKMQRDPRVTRVGRFLRRYSLDELPQLYNVLRGDMSLVGPRPPLPEEVATYTDYDRQRLSVTPGCTGLWQVSGRSDVDFAEMVQLDIRYINSASLWFDLRLIFATIGVMVRPNGAY